MQGNGSINIFIIMSAISEVLTFARAVVSVHITIVLKYNVVIQKTFFYSTHKRKDTTVRKTAIRDLFKHTIFYLILTCYLVNSKIMVDYKNYPDPC